jgi:hypothetical protein
MMNAVAAPERPAMTAAMLAKTSKLIKYRPCFRPATKASVRVLTATASRVSRRPGVTVVARRAMRPGAPVLSRVSATREPGL